MALAARSRPIKGMTRELPAVSPAVALSKIRRKHGSVKEFLGRGPAANKMGYGAVWEERRFAQAATCLIEV